MYKIFASLLLTAIAISCEQNLQPPDLDVQNIDKVCDQIVKQRSIFPTT